MDIKTVRNFLIDNHRGVLVARKRDGSPQITLVTPAVDVAGDVIISSRKRTFKVRNISRDPRVSLLVMGEHFSGSRYFQIEGVAKIVALPYAMDPLMDFYRRTLGGRMKSEETRTKIIEEERVLIRITIGGVGPQKKG